MTGIFGGIEAGGTKFVLAVGAEPNKIDARHEIPTRDPAGTMAEAAEWFESQGQLKALGIATFGPAELNRQSPKWGHILQTPKPGWSNCDIAGFFAKRFAVPIGFDTDVNGAALAEYRFRTDKQVSSLAYVTVGTGIGGGLLVDGKPIHGAAHPEMGHMFPRRHPADTEFEGVCPHHGDCLEGLASGPAIKARWGASLSELPQDHEAHAVIAEYLAQLCHTIFAVAAAEVVVLGGGVSKTPKLVEAISSHVRSLDQGYLPGHKRHAIVRPMLGNNSGAIGSLLLGEMALDG